MVFPRRPDVAILVGIATICLLTATTTFGNDRAAQPPRTALRPDLLHQPGLLKAEYIFHQPPFPHCHASTIAETRLGLVCAWFGGTDEGEPDVGIWFSRQLGPDWTPPVELANGIVRDGERHPCWNPVLFFTPGGKLLLFYKIGPDPDSWWGMLVESDDHGTTWNAPRRLPHDVFGPIRAKPVLLPDGRLLCGSSTEDQGWRVHVEWTADFGHAWGRSGALNDGKEFAAIQPTILTHTDARLQILCRSDDNLRQAWSSDGGHTWTRLEKSTLPNPSAGIDAVNLKDGRKLLVYNHSTRRSGGRSKLNVALSEDGQTWLAALKLEDVTLDDGSGAHGGYPAAIQASDGLVHVTYTGWRSQRIHHVVIDPKQLQARPMNDDGSWPEPTPDYLGIVKTYAEVLLENGRDTYGAVHSPLVAVTLQRQTRKLHDESGRKALWNIRLDDWENWGIRNSDRIYSGANPMRDQNLYQVLYALTAITGDEHYAREANRTLRWFFENCQSPTTGLLAWGEHLGWDFFDEVPVAKRKGDGIHEFARPWVLWERSFELAPSACKRYARGLWEHQIADHKTGDFSRHAMWGRHDVAVGDGYPRHGGFYITTWSEAYARSKEPVFLQAIDKLVDHYNRTSHPRTGAISCCTRPERVSIIWPESNLSLAVDLWDAAARVPVDLAEKMRARARKTDEIYLSLAHDFSPEGKGFVCGANAATLERKIDGGWTDSDLWATSYGKPTDAQIVLLCHLRYQQTKDERYKRLILACASRYLSGPPRRQSGLHPMTLGHVIKLMLVAEDLTGDKAFLRQAHRYARMAVRLFLRDQPLPRATSKYPHYEAVSGGDTLMMAFLELWLRQHDPSHTLNLVFSDR